VAHQRQHIAGKMEKKRPVFVLRLSDNNVRVVLQRQQLDEKKQAMNIRASVESMVSRDKPLLNQQ
jgi:hypothetical protein